MWSMILVTFPLLISRLMVLCDMTFVRCWKNISSNSFMKLLLRSVQIVSPTSVGRSGLCRLGMDFIIPDIFHLLLCNRSRGDGKKDGLSTTILTVLAFLFTPKLVTTFFHSYFAKDKKSLNIWWRGLMKYE